PAPYAANAGKLFSDSSAFVVLDLPCGDGRNLPPLALSAPVVLAFDTSTNALRISEEAIRKGASHKNILFRQTDIFATGLPDEAVDGILCWDTLGHLAERERALRALWRICRPVGHIVMNVWTPNDCQPQDARIGKIGDKEYLDPLDLYLRCYERGD